MPTCLKLSTLDRKILNRLQEDIPFTERPWGKIAEELNTKEDLLLRRIAFLKRTGIIRRISATFAPRRINFVSTLAAVKTVPGKIARAAKKINSYPEVTHNYRRSGPYELWFTIVAKNKERIAEIIRELEKDKNIANISQFPSIKLFKINVRFHV